jgi:predicted AAA+ superfamily ATPase
MKSVLLQMLAESADRFKAPDYERTAHIDPFKRKVQTIVGPRRAGKSSLLKLAIHQLITQGVSWDNICYLPLEDERLRGEPFEPDLILQAFQELHPDKPTLDNVHFFFDEIQYLNKWEPFINRIQEQITRNVIITGSNSKLLHTEVASVLRGRSLSMELLPLSFLEYLRFKNIDVKLQGSGKALIVSAFNDYLLWGGFPEIVLADPADRHPILQEYFNTMLYRDILDMQQPANYSYLRYLFHRIAANTGKTIALRKIFLELKSRGYAVSLNSIYEMADLAESVYLFKRISRFDSSLIKRENAEKKSYFIDNGMLHAIDNSFSSNLGTQLENLVFWQLYRMYGNIHTTDIYYYADNHHECDFLLYKEGGQALPIQVCLQMNDEVTRQRELKSLAKACNQTDSAMGIIITREEEGQFTYQGIQVNMIAAWKWCAKPVDLYLMGQ